jgi:hypothetical protein
MKRNNSLRSGENTFSEHLLREAPRLTEIDTNRSDAREETPSIYPADTAGQKSHGSAAAQPDGKQALVELVWKHFGEEITEILREVQKDFALGQRSAESSVTRQIGK